MTGYSGAYGGYPLSSYPVANYYGGIAPLNYPTTYSPYTLPTSYGVNNLPYYGYQTGYSAYGAVPVSYTGYGTYGPYDAVPYSGYGWPTYGGYGTNP